jgi:hypothetical protein
MIVCDHHSPLSSRACRKLPSKHRRVSTSYRKLNVRYLQALWDQISSNPDEVPVPESHLHLAEECLRRYREDPSTAKPAFEVIDRLTRKSA